MLRIAKCGHIRFQEGDLEAFVSSFARAAGFEAPIVVSFESPDALVSACIEAPTEAPFDIVMCKCDLPSITGVQVADELRQEGLLFEGMRVILCAPNGSYAYAAAQNGVSGYLLEPISPRDARRVIGQNLVRAERTSENSTILRCRDRLRRVVFDQITYVETAGHDQLVHRMGESEPLVVRCSSLELFSHLEDDERFFKVGSSYIINMDYVASVLLRAGTVALQGGLQIPVPVRLRKQLVEAVCSHSAIAV